MADSPRSTPMLDELEKGPWPSFVTQIKEMADEGKEECDQLLGLLERSYHEKVGHWKHGGIVGVMGYGGGVIGRYSDLPGRVPCHRPLPHHPREPARGMVLHLRRPANHLRHLGSARVRPHQHARLHGRHHPPGNHHRRAGAHLRRADPERLRPGRLGLGHADPELLRGSGPL